MMMIPISTLMTLRRGTTIAGYDPLCYDMKAASAGVYGHKVVVVRLGRLGGKQPKKLIC